MSNNLINVITGLLLLGTIYFTMRKTVSGKIIRMFFKICRESLILVFLLLNVCYNYIKKINSNLETNKKKNNTDINSSKSKSKELKKTSCKDDSNKIHLKKYNDNKVNSLKNNVINLDNDDKHKTKWQIGDDVKIGFMKLKLVDITKDGYILTNNKNQKYQFVPYKGLKKII